MSTDFDAGPHCHSCPAQVIWAHTVNGKPVLVDAEPVPGGNIRLTPRTNRPPLSQVVAAHLAYGRTDLRVVHFTTCPHAKSHRKRGHS